MHTNIQKQNDQSELEALREFWQAESEMGEEFSDEFLQNILDERENCDWNK